MLQRTMEYEDFLGNKRKEDFFFNLTKAELIELELSAEGGLEKTINKIINAQDMNKLIELFKKIVIMAYGEVSPDGKRFIKTQEVKENFMQTQAYSDLFMELATDDKAALKFVKGIMPKDIDLDNMQKNNVVAMHKQE